MKERRKSECFLIILYYFTIQPATEQCTVSLFPCVTVDTDKHGVVVRKDRLVLSDNVKQVNTTGLNGFTDMHISWGEGGKRERERKMEGERERERERGRERWREREREKERERKMEGEREGEKERKGRRKKGRREERERG